MALDRTTDAIAHFVGEFSLLSEEGRLRPDLQPFDLDAHEGPDTADLAFEQVEIETGHDLGTYKPTLSFEVPPPTPMRLEGLDFTTPPPPLALEIAAGDIQPLLAEFPNAITGGMFLGFEGNLNYLLVSLSPSEISTITVQHNVLFDDDVLLNNGATSFVDPGHFHDVLDGLVQIAFDLAAPGTASVTATGTAAGSATTTALGTPGPEADAAAWREFAEAFKEAELPEGPGFSTHQASGKAAAGVTVNGVEAEELPNWTDNLPQALRDEDEDDVAAATADDAADGPTADTEDETTDGGVDDDTTDGAVDGEAETGEDTPDIAPSGNGDQNGREETAAEDTPSPGDLPLLKDPLAPEDDDDDAFGVDPGHEIIAGANQVTNEAFITTNVLDAPVIAVAGDVIQLDAISQVNILVDDASTDGVFDLPAPTDTTEDDEPGSSEPAETRTQEGASRVLNAAEITAVSSEPEDAEDDTPAGGGAPLFVDLVRHEGDLLIVNEITQHNFVSDNDLVDFSFSAGATHVGVGGNIVSNVTNLEAFGFNYDLILVGGEMHSLNVVSQVNVLLDFDIPETGAAPAPATMATEEDDDGPDLGTGAPAAAPGVSSGDNLLLNQAEIIREGVDTITDMTATFADAIRDLANGAQELAASVAHDALFQGTEVLRALYIDGDLRVRNEVEQHNVVGDADQVRSAIDDFVQEFGTDVEAAVTTGSNALMNAASIRSLGLDSVVQAEGETYSDLLLHQAGFVQDPTEEVGLDPAALAAEAVAFLVDGMLQPERDEGPAAVPDFDAGMPSADVMQTMLA